MKLTHLWVVFMVCVPCCAMAQDCPQWGDHEGAIQFLLEHRSNSTTVEPACVDRTFATLSHDKRYVEILIELLDFERSTEHDDFISRGSQYPAIDALMTIGKPAVPDLIKAIKDSSSELIRMNAAHTLDGMNPACPKQIIDRLESEVLRSHASVEQQERLRAAEKYIKGRHGPVLCKSGSSA